MSEADTDASACPSPEAGFTLFEAIVSLAVCGLILSALAPLYGVNLLRARRVDGRLDLAVAGRTLLESLPARDDLRAGSVSGDSGRVRWRLDAAPLSIAADNATARFTPMRIILNLAAPDGSSLRLETVRLAQRPSP